jgi:hypothetical protein
LKKKKIARTLPIMQNLCIENLSSKEFMSLVCVIARFQIFSAKFKGGLKRRREKAEARIAPNKVLFRKMEVKNLLLVVPQF